MMDKSFLNKLSIDENFFTESFDKAPKHFQNFFEDVEEFFSLKDLNEILNTNSLSPDSFQLYKSNEQLSLTGASKNETMSKEKVNDAIVNQDYSLKIYNIDRYCTKLSFLKKELSAFFLRKVSINLYLTPSTSPCYLEHQDSYNIFIIQVEGEKNWYLHRDSSNIPLLKSEMATIIGESNQVNLKKGDVLYMPTSILHKAENKLPTPSLHLTIGLHPFTYEDLLNHALKSKKAQIFLKQPIRYDGPNLDIDTSRDRSQKFIMSIFDNMNFEAVIKEQIITQSDSAQSCFGNFNLNQTLFQKKLSENDTFSFNLNLVIDSIAIDSGNIRLVAVHDNYYLPIAKDVFEEKIKHNVFTASDFRFNDLNTLNLLYSKGIIRIHGN